MCFHSGNTGVISVLQSRTAETNFQMHWLQCFSLYCAVFNFLYSAVHIPVDMSKAADAFSHNDIFIFSSLIPQTPPILHTTGNIQPTCQFTTALGLTRLDNTVQRLFDRGRSPSTWPHTHQASRDIYPSTQSSI